MFDNKQKNERGKVGENITKKSKPATDNTVTLVALGVFVHFGIIIGAGSLGSWGGILAAVIGGVGGGILGLLFFGVCYVVYCRACSVFCGIRDKYSAYIQKRTDTEKFAQNQRAIRASSRGIEQEIAEYRCRKNSYIPSLESMEKCERITLLMKYMGDCELYKIFKTLSTPYMVELEEQNKLKISVLELADKYESIGDDKKAVELRNII